MLGAIAGDVIGSAYESSGQKRFDFPLFTEWSRFTDDTVMTVAIAKALLEDRPFTEVMREVGRQYPHAGYGARFLTWLLATESYENDSWGNGAAMRASPVGYVATSAEQALEIARCTAETTHGHIDGIRGAQAVALAVFLARTGASKAEMRDSIRVQIGYDLSHTVESIRPTYQFDVAAAGSVPQAIVSFLDASDFESAVRNAVSLGGDADTMACIAGAIAEAHWGRVPSDIEEQVRARLPEVFIAVIEKFRSAYGVK